MQVKKCSKCKLQFTFDNFQKCKTGKFGLYSYCKSCSKIQQTANKNSIYSNREYRRNILMLFTISYLKNHGCIDCGKTDYRCLEFDHVDGVKYKEISKIIQGGYSLTTLKNEITKCEVRCANCHRRKTIKQFNYFSYINFDELEILDFDLLKPIL